MIIKLFDYYSKIISRENYHGQSQRGFHLPKIFSKAIFESFTLKRTFIFRYENFIIFQHSVQLAKNILKNNCREFQIMKYIRIPRHRIAE